jgi:hypothetical protein
LLHQDFLRFVDALAGGEGEAWDLYCKHYLSPNRAVLDAWWEQCLGLPVVAWTDRVQRVRPEEYELLRQVVSEADLGEMARDTVERCQGVIPLRPAPEVYFLVGFFSPDGFAFFVDGRWAIGIGLERLTSSRLIPVLVAHEYAHCYRRRLSDSRTLGERLVDEGFAVALSARAFPERSEAEQLLMRPGQVAALRDYEAELWQHIGPHLGSEESEIAGKLLYGRSERAEWPGRAGVYLGWRLVSEFLADRRGGFDSAAERVLEMEHTGSAGRLA